jgi:hypothetical protein
MNTQDFEVIDRNGKRVRRDGVLQDGDTLRVPLRLVDGADPALTALAAAASLADAVKRNEQFDARGHRPGYATQVASTDGATARDQYHARNRDAWRNPPPVVDQKPNAPDPVLPTASNEQLFAARDMAVTERDRRLESAWKS